MLSLTRKSGEKVVVTVPPSDEQRKMVLTVVKLDDGRLRLQVDAPESIIVMREELVGTVPKGNRKVL